MNKFFEDSYRATFKQVDEETNRLAQLLVASGVKPGSCVAVLFQNSPQGAANIPSVSLLRITSHN